MRIPASLESEIHYSRKLLEAGLDAVTATGGGTRSKILKQELARSARKAWPPVIVGSAVGLMAVCFAKKGKSGVGGGASVGALLGGAIGFGVALVWNSRNVTSQMLRNAGKNLSVVRNQRWLEKHPIDFA